MTFAETLQKLKDNIESTTVVTLSARKLWASTIEDILDRMEEDDDGDDFDDDDDDDERESEGDSYLSPKASFQVSYALGIPQWKVDEDHEDAILQLCELAQRRKR